MTIDTFIDLVRRSLLIDPGQLDAALADLAKRPEPASDAAAAWRI